MCIVEYYGGRLEIVDVEGIIHITLITVAISYTMLRLAWPWLRSVHLMCIAKP